MFDLKNCIDEHERSLVQAYLDAVVAKDKAIERVEKFFTPRFKKALANDDAALAWSLIDRIPSSFAKAFMIDAVKYDRKLPRPEELPEYKITKIEQAICATAMAAHKAERETMDALLVHFRELFDEIIPTTDARTLWRIPYDRIPEGVVRILILEKLMKANIENPFK